MMNQVNVPYIEAIIFTNRKHSKKMRLEYILLNASKSNLVLLDRHDKPFEQASDDCEIIAEKILEEQESESISFAISCQNFISHVVVDLEKDKIKLVPLEPYTMKTCDGQKHIDLAFYIEQLTWLCNEFYIDSFETKGF